MAQSPDGGQHTPDAGGSGRGLAVALAGIELARPQAGGGRRRILAGLDLQLAPGEQLAIVGPSGAGKTSLLQVAAGALRPDAGEVLLGARPFWALTARARRRQRHALFLAPQVPPLPPRQRVVLAVLAGRLPALGFWRGLLALFHPAELPLVESALARFGLGGRLFDRVDLLSGGERLRVGLARALVAPARLWLLDEPLAALDPVQAGEVLAVICAEARRRGVTLIVSLHQAELAKGHFARLLGLRDGRVVFDGPAAAIGATQWQALYEAERAPAPAPAPAR